MRIQILLILALLTSSFAYLVNLHIIENPKNPQMAPTPASIAEYYFFSQPDYADGPIYGNASAGIQMIMFFEPGSETSKRFMTELFPSLDEEFIAQGKVNLYHRNHIELRDIHERNDKFKYAVSLSCISRTDSKYNQFYIRIMNGSTIAEASEDLGISMDELNNCIEGEVPPEIFEDAADVERLGMSGVSPIIYIGIEGLDTYQIEGIPTYIDLRRKIREYQTIIGD